MKKLALTAIFLSSCASPGPHNDMANDVWSQVRWTAQEEGIYDQQYLGCRSTGDCDDQALCAACKLLGEGANPNEIIIVYQGWEKGSNMTQYNHLSVEYKGECIMGYSNSRFRAYMGRCVHRYADNNMREFRRSLPEWMKLLKVVNICPFYRSEKQ